MRSSDERKNEYRSDPKHSVREAMVHSKRRSGHQKRADIKYRVGYETSVSHYLIPKMLSGRTLGMPESRSSVPVGDTREGGTVGRMAWMPRPPVLSVRLPCVLYFAKTK